MKISLALLILLLAAACTDIKAASFLSARSIKCCTEEMLFQGKIRSSKIQGYQYTASSCALRAALVMLEKGAVCVDPKKKWFQDYLRTTKKQNTIST